MIKNKAILLLASALLVLSDVDAFTIHRRESIAHKNRLPRAIPISERNITSRSLEKRFDGARLTFYNAGLGACGKTNSDSEFVAAMNADQYAGGAHCFESVTIIVGSKTQSAQIVDVCTGCPFAGLDLSQGLFEFFASTSVGVLTGSWNFADAAAPPTPLPKTTEHQETPTPTTTQKTTRASSTVHISSSASSSSDVSASSVSRTATLLGSAASASATAPGSDSASDTGNLQMINLAFIQMAGLVMAGGANGGGSS
ncbi:hypothetical protein JR316_0009143 [Psilocybe cubensis]|uniref:Uncharacterized protein n=2 Tax=Psilocybe cubensis TaxID=181762 RepID=A0ACB8GUM0_PSICU|nr:hypothetical protein JR316_0009143 [Psilocybe cubensis]KAH9478685.1 hypothetical protein JR316_0009143 [Psilocybe cubensis]